MRQASGVINPVTGSIRWFFMNALKKGDKLNVHLAGVALGLVQGNGTDDGATCEPVLPLKGFRAVEHFGRWTLAIGPSEEPGAICGAIFDGDEVYSLVESVNHHLVFRACSTDFRLKTRGRPAMAFRLWSGEGVSFG